MKEKVRQAMVILLEASGGLDISKPEYYKRQEFVVLPLKYYEQVCALLYEALEDEK